MFKASNNSIQVGAVLGLIGVAIGAFGAHGLKPHLSDYQIDIFEKGVQYHFIHAIALVCCGLIGNQMGWTKNFERASVLFLLGILFFSGSLYLLACRDLLPFSVALAGPITPLGGLCFMGGWALLGWESRLKRN